MKSNTHLFSAIISVFLLSSCGGGGGDGSSGDGNSGRSVAVDNEKYNSPHYKDLAGTWMPWVSESDYENTNSGEFFEIIFSRFGKVNLYLETMPDDEVVSINCFGNYSAAESNQTSSLQCNSSEIENEFFSVNFSSTFDDTVMVIKSLEVSNLSLSNIEQDMTLYKNPPFHYEAQTNVQPGIYEIFEIDNMFIQIFPNGDIQTIKNNALSLENDCEINGLIKSDPDYGLTTELPVNAVFIDTHHASINISGCTIREGIDYLINNVNINQNQQSSILRSGFVNESLMLELVGPGNSFVNGGNNAFYLSSDRVCDELGNPTDDDELGICGGSIDP